MSHDQFNNDPINREAYQIARMMDAGYIEEATQRLRDDFMQLARYENGQQRLVEAIQQYDRPGVGADIATRNLYRDQEFRADLVALVMRPYQQGPWDPRFPQWQNQGQWQNQHWQNPNRWQQPIVRGVGVIQSYNYYYQQWNRPR
ncbi:MAG TPA: hypothetical protein V6D17_00640 [Candidatus Obscuribacterales bacterium]